MRSGSTAPKGFVISPADLLVHLLIPRLPLPVVDYSETQQE